MIKIKVFNYQTGDFQETVLAPEAKTKKECTIGRSATCDLVLESSDVSRIHVKIQEEQNEYFFVDPGSANGSSINSQTTVANQRYSLKVDDLIRIGDFVLLIEVIEAPSAANPTLGLLHQTQNSLHRSGDRNWCDELTVRCVRVTVETADVKTFTFAADPAVRLKYKPGQFVTLNLEIDGKPVMRSYSLSSTPSRPHTLEITVKRVAAGLVSNWLHDTIAVGSEIKISAPMGKFTCVPHLAPKLLLISAGSGITPLMSMSRWVGDVAAATDITFFHCARTPRDIVFRQELELLSARLPNFHLALSVTQSEPGQAWSGFTGRLNEAMLRCIAPDFQDRKVYVCGPSGFMEATKALLEGLNFPMQNYTEESFGAPKKVKPLKPGLDKPAPVLPSIQPAQSVVLFSKSGKQVAHDGSESILELAEQEGIKIRSSCRQGVCGACKKLKLEGEVKYDTEPDALEPSDRAAGYILACAASPIGRVVIEA